MAPIERSLLLAVRWLIPSLVLTIPLLAIDIDGNLLTGTTIQLIGIVVATFGLTLSLAPIGDQGWFLGMDNPSRRLFAAAASIAAIATGYAALVTLASSAALGLSPSLQFLQLLSALDIAWVVAATVVGTRWIQGARTSHIAGFAMSVVCVWSIWRYLDEVGFGPNGEWIVSKAALNELVLPYDTMAAVIGIGAVLIGIRRRQATVQPSPQS